MDDAHYLLTCVDGIEPECAADALDLGARTAQPLVGKVLVEADEAFVYKANLAHPTANRVHRVLAQGEIHDLADVRRLLDEVAWEEVFDPSLAFAGDCVRSGEHAFTSLDVARVVGDAVIGRFRAATGARPPVNLNEPDVTVSVHVRAQEAFVTVDTTGDSLHMRGWRVAEHPAPLMPTLASAMVRWSGWRRGLLLDPLCGSGTIPIEADYRARGRPVNLQRSEWAFRRLRAYDHDAFERAREKLACGFDDEAPPILGNERYDKRLEGAQQNAEAARVSGALRWRCGDFNHLAHPEGLSAVVTNPPWGLRMTSRKVSDRIGRQLRAKLQEWAPETAVILMGNTRFEKEDPQPEATRDLLYGGVACRLLRYRFQ